MLKDPVVRAQNRRARSMCYERLLEAVGFATAVVVLLDGPLLSLAWERSLGGLQPGFWEQPPHASGLADVVHSRVEPLPPLQACSLDSELPSSEQPLRGLHSAVLACSPWRSPD
jgi:hypothetical protein